MKTTIRRLAVQGWPGLLAVVVGVVCFWLALAPVHTIETPLRDYAPGGKLEQADGINYFWTTPDLRLGYRDVPRFAPIYLKLEVLMDRPPEAPPARLEISERRDNISLPLATFSYTSGQEGYQQYLVKIPARASSDDTLLLDLKANGFRVPGDTRQLGVRLKSATVSVSKSGLVLAVIKSPVFPATVLLLIGLAWWCWLVGFGPLETLLLLAPSSFMAGAITNYLVYASWWLLVDALLLLATAALWHYRGREWLGRGDRWRPLAVLMAGIAFFCGFYVTAPGLAGDIFYFREVLAPMLRYGPIGVYPHAPRLNYPPGAVFQLYLFGVIAQPFNMQFHQSAFKALMGSSLLFMFPLMWWAGLRGGVNREHLARTVLLFGFSLSMVFVPAVWVQADGWLLVLMVAALLMVTWGRPVLSAVTQAVGVIYKAQSWLLLPLYALTFQWRFGWKTTIQAGLLCLALIFGLGGLGFAFDPAVFRVFWNQPAVSGESDWGGIRSFNLMNLLGYDTLRVPQPLLGFSYGAVAVIYLVVLAVCWRRNYRISQETAKGTVAREARSNMEWLLASAFILSFIFFFWVKMHERYLYFGLGFLIMAALYRRDLYRPALLFNLHFILNLLFAYLPERRDPVPNNFMFWRHFLHADQVQAALCIGGMLVCAWVGWLYFRPAPPPLPLPSVPPADTASLSPRETEAWT